MQARSEQEVEGQRESRPMQPRSEKETEKDRDRDRVDLCNPGKRKTEIELAYAT